MSETHPQSGRDSLEINPMLCFNIYAAGHAFNRLYKALLDPFELTYPQYLVMLSLWAGDDQTVSGLSVNLQLEPNTLTPILKRMEASGLVRRTRSQTDQRQVRITLTPDGAALQDGVKDLPQRLFTATGLTGTQFIQMSQALAQLCTSLTLAAADAGLDIPPPAPTPHSRMR